MELFLTSISAFKISAGLQRIFNLHADSNDLSVIKNIKQSLWCGMHIYIPRRKSGIYWIQVRRAAAAAAVEISLWTR